MVKDLQGPFEGSRYNFLLTLKKDAEWRHRGFDDSVDGHVKECGQYGCHDEKRDQSEASSAACAWAALGQRMQSNEIAPTTSFVHGH